MSSKSKIFFLILLSFGNSIVAQTKSIDSLKIVLKTAKHDTIKGSALAKLAEIASDEEWPEFNNQLLGLCKLKLFRPPSLKNREAYLFQKYYAFALNNLGYIEDVNGNISKAISFYVKSLNLLENLVANYNSFEDKKAFATAMNNLGSLYRNQGEIEKALNLFIKSLKIKEELNDQAGIAFSFNSIGLIHSSHHENDLALEYFNKSLKIRERIKDKAGIATTLINIGGVKLDQHKTEEAIQSYSNSLLLAESIHDNTRIAMALISLGVANAKAGNNNEALNYYLKSLEIREKLGDKNGIAYALQNIGFAYLALKQINLAKKYFIKSLSLSRELGFPQTISDCVKGLILVYKAEGDHQNALESYEYYISMRDSMNNESTRKASIKSQLKYEYEKQAAADSVAHAKESEIKNVELEKQKIEIIAKKNQQYALFGGLGLVVIFAGFMYNRFKITQKQKNIIEHQKEVVEEQKKIVEEKQKEVLDSIHYAKRIQTAHLPSEKTISKNLERLKKS